MVDDSDREEPGPPEEDAGHYADLLNETVWNEVVAADREREANQ